MCEVEESLDSDSNELDGRAPSNLTARQLTLAASSFGRKTGSGSNRSRP